MFTEIHISENIKMEMLWRFTGTVLYFQANTIISRKRK